MRYIHSEETLEIPEGGTFAIIQHLAYCDNGGNALK